MRTREVFTVRSFLLVEVGDRIQSHAVYAHVHPEVQGAQERTMYFRILEIEIGLM